MAFRKRNIPLTRNPQASSPTDSLTTTAPPVPGVRPSPLDGRPTTSTGTPSLDGILAGHGGLALGNSLLLEESGTTDFAGALLRFYAAEGVVQGHVVHVVGVGEVWARGLPGVVGGGGGGRDGEERGEKSGGRERMKIAWRYERLGEFGERRAPPTPPDRAPPSPAAPASTTPSAETTPFCHTFDLTKRLTIPATSTINYIPLTNTTTLSSSPFTPILTSLLTHLSSTPPHLPHRLIIPTLLSPALYPPHSSHPHHVLQFLAGLRALLRAHPTRLTALITLPLDLYPRSSGLVRWIELLSDGVVELTPFPHSAEGFIISGGSSGGAGAGAGGAGAKEEEQPQGMLRVHRLPVFHERGGGGGAKGLGEDLAFTLSRRKFVVRPFSLPPLEGDQEAQRGGAEGAQIKGDLSF